MQLTRSEEQAVREKVAMTTPTGPKVFPMMSGDKPPRPHVVFTPLDPILVAWQTATGCDCGVKPQVIMRRGWQVIVAHSPSCQLARRP
jgi:hypothetical protein